MTDSSMPNIRPEVSASLAEIEGLSGTAADLSSGSQSVADAFAALVGNKLFQDAVVALANGLTREAAVQWGVEAAKTVAAKLPDSELQALNGAEDWLTGDSSREELDALLKDDAMQGPGAWAAQAAAWADDAAGAAEGEAPPYGKAVESTVKLAAALTANDWPLYDAQAQSAATDSELAAQSPDLGTELGAAAMEAAAAAMSSADQEKPAPEQQLNDLLKPFVELGLKIAADRLAAG
jgi:hypothetical protein